MEIYRDYDADKRIQNTIQKAAFPVTIYINSNVNDCSEYTVY